MHPMHPVRETPAVYPWRHSEPDATDVSVRMRSPCRPTDDPCARAARSVMGVTRHTTKVQSTICATICLGRRVIRAISRRGLALTTCCTHISGDARMVAPPRPHKCEQHAEPQCTRASSRARDAETTRRVSKGTCCKHRSRARRRTPPTSDDDLSSRFGRRGDCLAEGSATSQHPASINNLCLPVESVAIRAIFCFRGTGCACPRAR
jgi:hypothetical protein